MKRLAAPTSLERPSRRDRIRSRPGLAPRVVDAAWADAPQHPLTSTVVTVGGLTAAAVAIVAVRHFTLVGRLRDVTGI